MGVHAERLNAAPDLPEIAPVFGHPAAGVTHPG
jgi:hypothetical protein